MYPDSPSGVAAGPQIAAPGGRAGTGGGEVQQPNLVTLSIGVAIGTPESGRFTDPREIIGIATEKNGPMFLQCIHDKLSAFDPKGGFCGSLGNLVQDPRARHGLGAAGDGGGHSVSPGSRGADGARGED